MYGHAQHWDAQSVELWFAPSSPLLNPARLETLQRTLEQHLGAHVSVKFEQRALTREQTQTTPHALLQRAQQEQHQADLLALQNDPFVQALQQRFNARLQLGNEAKSL